MGESKKDGETISALPRLVCWLWLWIGRVGFLHGNMDTIGEVPNVQSSAFRREIKGKPERNFVKLPYSPQYNNKSLHPRSLPCITLLNPLSPKSDERQISPCNINAL